MSDERIAEFWLGVATDAGWVSPEAHAAVVAERDALRGQVERVQALLRHADEYGDYDEHNPGCEGEPTCPACWVGDIRAALAGPADTPARQGQDQRDRAVTADVQARIERVVDAITFARDYAQLKLDRHMCTEYPDPGWWARQVRICDADLATIERHARAVVHLHDGPVDTCFCGKWNWPCIDLLARLDVWDPQ